MRLDGREESNNIEDRRFEQTPRRRVGGKTSLTSLLLIGVITYIMSGGDIGAVLQAVLSNATQSAPTQSVSQRASSHDQQYAKLVGVVLKDTEDIWSNELRKYGITYHKPKLVLYRGVTKSGCGMAQNAMGPFYCPVDQKVYLDLSFFDELQNRFGAKGDFAEAYVIAHEVAHHVQNELGILEKVHQAQRRSSKIQANKLSVKLELQADCFSGVWAKLDEKKNHILEAGDIDEALNAASQIGDDTLQKKAQGYVVPDSFTHGTSKQRREWFYRGFQSGDINACNTFKVL